MNDPTCERSQFALTSKYVRRREKWWRRKMRIDFLSLGSPECFFHFSVHGVSKMCTVFCLVLVDMENLFGVRLRKGFWERKIKRVLCSDGVMQFCVYVKNTNHLLGYLRVDILKERGGDGDRRDIFWFGFINNVSRILQQFCPFFLLKLD